MNTFKKCFALFLAAVLVLTASGCSSEDYSEALEDMAEEDYQDAAEIFRELGDYKDSAKLALECDYREAMRVMDKGRLEQAAELFELLGDYKDSEDMANECWYSLASEYSEKGYEERAAEMLSHIHGQYKDNAELLETLTAEIDLTGVWVAEKINIADAVRALLAYSFDEEIETFSEYFPIEEFYITKTVEFDGFGTYSVIVDRQSFEAAMSSVSDVLRSGFEGYLYDVLIRTAVAQGVSEEQLLTQAGTRDKDEFIRICTGMSAEENYDDTFGVMDLFGIEAVSDGGTYSVRGTKLEIGSELAEYDVKTDVITVTGDGSSASGLYPYTLVRA